MVQARHLIGGEIYYDYLGGNDYQVNLVYYVDCDELTQTLGQGNNDDQASISIFDADGTLVNNAVIDMDVFEDVPIVSNIACLVNLPDLCIKKKIFSAVFNLPPKVGGYSITWQRCCRGSIVSNLVNPQDVGSTYTAVIPGSELVPSNNSPRFGGLPPTVLCNNIQFTFDHSATDPDGDDLVYEFCTPYDGASAANPQPVFPNAPPYQFVPWLNNYDELDPIDANPQFQIDPSTGVITGIPTQLGHYVIGICVKEYRNGVLIGETRRDYTVTTNNCEVDAIAAIPEQEDFCSGFTLEFSNAGSLGEDFFWNFGDTTTNSDTSWLVNPNWTYSTPGFVNITLIAYGNVCNDTANIEYKVIPDDSAHFLPLAGQCLEGNEYIFEQDGFFSVQSTFLWDFGETANPDTSVLGNPPPITFDEAGTFPVTLTIFRDICETSYTDSVEVWAHPRAEFEPTDTMGCEPFLVEFLDKSFSETPMLYFWSLGDGDSSVVSQPSHEYRDTGLFYPQLTVISTGRCIDTNTLVFPEPIRVYQTPTSDFRIDPSRTDILNPIVQIRDRSSDHDECRYWVGDDSLWVEDCDFTREFAVEGKYFVVQEVTTEFGCRDTSFKEVRILPKLSLWVPNAFTPNGDGDNDIFIPKLEGATGFQMRIYDRWGEELFSTHDYRVGWNGTYRGVLSQQGTYIYAIRVIDLAENREKKFHGQLTLIRPRD